MSETIGRKVPNISRTGGNVYNKMDKDTWMVIPSYEEVMIDHLRYQGGNFRKLALFPEDRRRPLTDISDEEVMDIVRKEMMGQ